jgi:hypothetical protein
MIRDDHRDEIHIHKSVLWGMDLVRIFDFIHGWAGAGIRARSRDRFDAWLEGYPQGLRIFEVSIDV